MLHDAQRDPNNKPQAEFRKEIAKGQLVWFDLAVSKFPDEEYNGFQIVITDRTSERRLEEDLRQAQKIETIGQLAGGIAHDFNNLLTVINGFTSLAMGRLMKGDATRELLEQVCKAGERAAALTRQILVFSKKEILEPVSLDLNEMIREVEKMLRRLIGNHISLQCELSTPLGMIKADPSQIEQIIFNLATNARDAMANGGTLLFKTEDRIEDRDGRKYVRLISQDTGCGMTQEVKDHIFEPFFTTKAVGKGTGLGLATVWSILQQLGARIQVVSEVGKGTQFTIDFPRIDCHPLESAKPTAEPDVLRGRETILIAEDDSGVRALAQNVLIEAGYRVLSTENGLQALAVSGKHPEEINLLLADVVMPAMGGWQTSEEIRQQRPSLKVLFMSGYDDGGNVQQAVLLRKAGFLRKPFSKSALLIKVREVLDQ